MAAGCTDAVIVRLVGALVGHVVGASFDGVRVGYFRPRVEVLERDDVPTASRP